MTGLVARSLAAPLSLALLATVALCSGAGAQGLIVSGYGDIEWALQDRGDEGWKHAFDNHHLNLILLGAIAEDLLVGVEVEYEHAGGEIALEYAYIGYAGFENVRLAGGKFIVPFNRWNKDVHPTWISKMPGRPLTYENVFPATYSDVGVWASGALPVGGGSRVVWDAYIVNGLEGEADATSFRGLRDNDREQPRRGNDKAIGARLGLELAEGLGLGASAYSGEYAENEATEGGLRISFFGADIDYHLNGLELRGEFVSANQEVTTGSDSNNRTGFYAQAAYEVVDRFEPVARYSWVNFEEDNADTSELGIGFSYYVGSSSAVRLAYFFNFEQHEEFETDNDRLIGQFVIAF